MTADTATLHPRAPQVLVGAQALRARLAVAEAAGLAPDQQAAADGVRELLDRAERAAYGIEPRPGRILRDRWSGKLIETAYEYLHAARAQMVDVYDEPDLTAEIPVAVARAQQTLHRDDPRRPALDRLATDSVAHQRALLRRAIEDSYDSMDRQHQRLRSFRNIILVLAIFIIALVAATVLVVMLRPSIMPLCFPASTTGGGAAGVVNCPSGSRVTGPDELDVMVVGLLGLLGGALAAAVSIRNLKGTSTPYDVPVALSCLKVPLGAFTAILGVVAIRGDFVPGLSRLDSQQQILAYALVLGFAQQVFTRSLDRRAQTLLEALPAKDASGAPPTTSPPSPPAATRVTVANLPAQSTVTLPDTTPALANGAGTSIDVNRREPQPAVAYQSPPPVDDDNAVQDEGDPPMPGPPPEDHR